MEIRQLKYFIAAAKHLNFTKAAAEDMEEFKEGYDHVINAKAVIDATGGYAGNSQMELELLHNEYYPLNREQKNGLLRHLRRIISKVR